MLRGSQCVQRQFPYPDLLRGISDWPARDEF